MICKLLPKAILLVWLVSQPLLHAQESIALLTPERTFRHGMELYEKQKFGAAQVCFESVLSDNQLNNTLIMADAMYYDAMCALRLSQKDAENLVNNFLAKYPEATNANNIRFETGRYFYTAKRFRDASRWFDKVDKARLNAEDQAEYYFKSGYAYFMTDDLEKARYAFNEIKDIDTRYTPPAIYYYSHIAYTQQNYETALEGFKKLETDETFSPIVPYYIVQILYLQKKYDELIDYAPGKLETVSEKRLPETAHLIGDAYFKKGLYTEAVPYLERYRDKTPSMSNEDVYVLGYAYYKTGRYEDAVSTLVKVTGSDSELKQNAVYVLADCYIRLNDKNNARMAFAAASRMNFDPVITEDALFNYAKVTYELSYSPFNEAIRTFNDYITRYPGSKRIDEAYNYLVQVYLNTKNYKDALASIQKIRVKDDRVKKAWQRVAYFRALELFNNLDFHAAIDMFDVSLQYGQYDRLLKASAYYWKGEAWYRLEDYTEAASQYSEFIESPGAASTGLFSTAYYNLAYSYFKLKNYTSAAVWFAKYLDEGGKKSSAMLADANNRMGDCCFIRSDYAGALTYYNRAIDMKKYDADYALFQKGFSLGLMDKDREKITVLNTLLAEYPGSSYVDDALFELGNSYMKLQDQKKALDFYLRIINDYKGSSYVKKATVQAGLAYRNLDKDEDALRMYKVAIAEYPGTTEAQSALTGIQNIYVERGDADGYVDYLKSIGSVADISASTQDSIIYKAAENLYLTGDCSKSTEALRKYLDRFPNGIFVLNAQYYLGDCEDRSNHYDEALRAYNYVIGKPRNMFTEGALLGAARINYNNQNYRDAAGDYKMLESLAELKNNILEARIGTMRCYDKLSDWQEAYDAANSVLGSEKVSDDLTREARFIMARSAANLGKNDIALENYRKVAVEVKSIEGAESKYRIAEILWQNKQSDKAEKEIFDFINKNTPHQYWMARAFILLADIYVEKKNNFQALQTLQSVIDYYDKLDDGIIQMALQRKKAIEATTTKPAESGADTLEIHMNGNKK